MADRDVDARPEGGRVREETRARILAAATDLLAHEGRDAVTTRAVAVAAGVQAPALYRLFGDKRGLLDAVAEHGFLAYMAEKGERELGKDPVADLRRGWNLHVSFGLANPAIYALMYADPRPGARPPVAEVAYGHLRTLMSRIAAAGRLRMPEERAAQLVHSVACGTVLTLLAASGGQSDSTLSEVAREATLKAIVADAPPTPEAGPVAAAVTLRSQLNQVECFTQGERTLMVEWLDRMIESFDA